MKDCVIIGSGPAGLSAALTLAANNIDFEWLGRNALSEKVGKSELIRNYPGLTAVSGKEMQRIFREQIEKENLPLSYEIVSAVYDVGDGFTVQTDKREINSLTVILATGVESVKPIPGETEYLGRGVSYCATCDGRLYKGKKMAVISDSKEYEEEARFLVELAGSLLFIPLYKDFNAPERAEVISGKRPSLISGDLKARTLEFSDGTSYDVDVVFVLRNAVSPSSLIYGIETDNSHVVVNRKMETSIKGVFACGDCTGRPYQNAKAVGEGNVAAFSAIEFIRNNKKK